MNNVIKSTTASAIAKNINVVRHLLDDASIRACEAYEAVVSKTDCNVNQSVGTMMTVKEQLQEMLMIVEAVMALHQAHGRG